ncbi:MAG: FAD:protein FMN transferase [Actinobacteria bacterium]|nr:FAD:protein FMN transferase [Actinomycetota bacterium]
MYADLDFPAMATRIRLTILVSGQPEANRLGALLGRVFEEADRRFNAARSDSEISRIRRGELSEQDASEEIQRVLDRCRLVFAMTDGAFTVRTPEGDLDVAGVAKGWALKRASEWLLEHQYSDWRLAADGDVLTSGQGPGGDWQVEIHDRSDNSITTLAVNGHALATTGPGSGIIRASAGATPYEAGAATVVGPCIDIADALATGSWALGRAAISVLDRVPEYHLMMVTDEGVQFSHGFPRETLMPA